MEIDDSDGRASPPPLGAGAAAAVRGPSTPVSAAKRAPRASDGSESSPGTLFVFGSPEHVPQYAQRYAQSGAVHQEASFSAGHGSMSVTRRRSKKSGSSSSKKRSRKLYVPKGTSAFKKGQANSPFEQQTGGVAGDSAFATAPGFSEIPRVFSSFEEIAQQYQAPDKPVINSAGATGRGGEAASAFAPSAPVPPPQPPPPPTHQVQSDALKQRGNIKYNEGDYVGAIQLYSQAIRLSPMTPTYLLNRSAALIQLQRFGDAVEDSNRATEMDETLVVTFNRQPRYVLMPVEEYIAKVGT